MWTNADDNQSTNSASKGKISEMQYYKEIWEKSKKIKGNIYTVSNHAKYH